MHTGFRRHIRLCIQCGVTQRKQHRPGTSTDATNHGRHKSTTNQPNQPRRYQTACEQCKHMYTCHLTHHTRHHCWSLVWFRWVCTASCGCALLGCSLFGFLGVARLILPSPCKTRPNVQAQSPADDPRRSDHNSAATRLYKPMWANQTLNQDDTPCVQQNTVQGLAWCTKHGYARHPAIQTECRSRRWLGEGGGGGMPDARTE